jgi:hypothetical protein
VGRLVWNAVHMPESLLWGADASRIHDQKLWSSCIISMLVMIFNVEFEFEFIYIL